MSSVPEGRAANQPFAVTTFSPPSDAPFPGARVSVAVIVSPASSVALMSSALLYVAGLAMRARRTARARVRPDGLIEARHLGGHHWVAYGWNERS